MMLFTSLQLRGITHCSLAELVDQRAQQRSALNPIRTGHNCPHLLCVGMSFGDVPSVSRRAISLQIIVAGLPDACAGSALQRLAPILRKVVGLMAASQQAGTLDICTVLGESDTYCARVIRPC